MRLKRPHSNEESSDASESSRADPDAPETSAWRRVLGWIVPLPDPKSRGNRVWWYLKRLLLWYAVVLVVFGIFQRKLMYHPTVVDSLPADAAGFPDGRVRDFTVTTNDGLTLHGWRFVPGDSSNFNPDVKKAQHENAAPRLLVLYFHGNGGNRRHRVPECETLNRLGAEVLILDYRGYAENPGSPTEKGLLEDARALRRYAVEELDVDPGRIVLYGESLGGGPATALAAEMCDADAPPGALILRSTFSSMVDAGYSHFPWLPVRLLLLDRYRSDQKIQQVTCPILQFHGTRDRVVPIELGERLFAVAPAQSRTGLRGREKQFVKIDGAGHNDLMLSEPEIRRAIRALFESLAAAPERR